LKQSSGYSETSRPCIASRWRYSCRPLNHCSEVLTSLQKMITFSYRNTRKLAVNVRSLHHEKHRRAGVHQGLKIVAPPVLHSLLQHPYRFLRYVLDGVLHCIFRLFDCTPLHHRLVRHRTHGGVGTSCEAAGSGVGT